MKKVAIYLAVFALAVVGSGMAHAHTTSIGFVSAGTPGNVTFYTGTYGPAHTSSPVNEGSLTLVGINGNTYASTTMAFDLGVFSIKPTGLVDGTSNFYWDYDGTSGFIFDPSLTSDPKINNTRSGPTPVVWWQGVTFSGLGAGDYSFTCGTTCGTTVTWNSLSGASGSGTFTLTGAVVGDPVPEPGTIVLMGTGLLGLALWGRKKQQANS